MHLGPHSSIGVNQLVAPGQIRREYCIPGSVSDVNLKLIDAELVPAESTPEDRAVKPDTGSALAVELVQTCAAEVG